MSFNDDEEIVLDDNVITGEDVDVLEEGNVDLQIINSSEAPLREFVLPVMLEVTALGNVNIRPGLDLVTVLDVSGSMKGDKTRELKRAMAFMLKKLSPIDRLSIITFSASANRLCPLRQMTQDSKNQTLDLINNIVADGDTNITDGLQKALLVLKDRRLQKARFPAIMLMSDGEQNLGGDAAQVQLQGVPVYTFGFGNDNQDSTAMAGVLKAIAENGAGGTFSDVKKIKDLNAAFANCLAGLLTVAVQELIVHIAPKIDSKRQSRIAKVSAGDCVQERDNETVESPVSVTIGVLYHRETRRIMVDLVLPEVSGTVTAPVLIVTHQYSVDKDVRAKKAQESNPRSVSVTRTESFKELEQKVEMITEESRIKTAECMKEARVMADNKNLKGAKNKIFSAQSMLEDVDIEGSVPMIEMLKEELDQIMAYMQSPELYNNFGRSFALSSELSHDRQRFAARGNMEKLRLFSTPRMDAYQEQAKWFDEDPTKPVPSVDDDQKQDIAADPIGPIIGPLAHYLQRAIQALHSIEIILKSASRRK